MPCAIAVAIILSILWLLPAYSWPSRGTSFTFPTIVQQFFDRWATPPTDNAVAARYRARIMTLSDAGTLAKCDVVAFFDIAPDAPSSLINVVNNQAWPAIYGPTGNPIFAPGLGWKGVGLNKISLGINPSTFGGQFSRNSAAVVIKTTTTAKAASLLIDANVNTQLWPYYTDDTVIWRINAGSDSAIANAGASAAGLWILNRTAANAQAVYRDETPVDSNSVASVAPSDDTLYAPSGAFVSQFAAACSALDSNDRAAFQTMASQ